MDSPHHAGGKQFMSNRFEKYTRTETPRRNPRPVHDRGPCWRTPIRRSRSPADRSKPGRCPRQLAPALVSAPSRSIRRNNGDRVLA